eukprot:1601616-Pleurochrysis_carterae.AAC.1
MFLHEDTLMNAKNHLHAGPTDPAGAGSCAWAGWRLSILCGSIACTLDSNAPFRVAGRMLAPSAFLVSLCNLRAPGKPSPQVHATFEVRTFVRICRTLVPRENVTECSVGQQGVSAMQDSQPLCASLRNVYSGDERGCFSRRAKMDVLAVLQRWFAPISRLSRLPQATESGCRR